MLEWAAIPFSRGIFLSVSPSWSWKSKVPGPAEWVSGKAASRIPDTVERAVLSGSLSIIPFLRVGLPKAPPPNTFSWGLGFTM